MTVQQNLEQFALKKGRNVSGKEMSEPPRSFSREKKNLRGKQGLLISRGGFNGWICWPGRKAVFSPLRGTNDEKQYLVKAISACEFSFFSRKYSWKCSDSTLP